MLFIKDIEIQKNTLNVGEMCLISVDIKEIIPSIWQQLMNTTIEEILENKSEV